MNKVLRKIIEIVERHINSADFLDVLFGECKKEALSGRPIVICCAGGLGIQMIKVLREVDLNVVALCDNDVKKTGSSYLDTPIHTFQIAYKKHSNAIFVIAAQKYREIIYDQLLEMGISQHAIRCSDTESELIYQYIGEGTQSQIALSTEALGTQKYIDYLVQRQDRISAAYDSFYDDKSRQLLVTKLAVLVSQGQFSLFSHFIKEFSEPYRDFGLMGYDGTPEDYYYFNNDFFEIENNEVYIDVGAFDGDSIETFLQACVKKEKFFKKIVAFEPDPYCYEKLEKKFLDHDGISLSRLGLWSKTTQLRFSSSKSCGYEQGASISNSGDIIIDVTSLDDFLQGERVTLLKMDPPGNIIPEVLQGAYFTIQKFQPKLAVGAYHGPDSIFEIPLLLQKICPEYRMALRQNTCHLCDTDLLATVKVEKSLPR